jgi:septal ring factor EnvC (AmiA/AmiB activator)
MASHEPATKADIESVVLLLQQMAERFDHRFEEVDKRFDAVDRRFEAVENRLDRIGDTLAGLQTQMAGMTRWSDRLDRDHSAVLGTQEAQRQAIDSLAERVTRLEQRQQN